MLINSNQITQCTSVANENAQFKALSAFVILFNLFINTYGLSSVKTYRERLDSLESIVESLKE